MSKCVNLIYHWRISEMCVDSLKLCFRLFKITRFSASYRNKEKASFSQNILKLKFSRNIKLASFSEKYTFILLWRFFFFPRKKKPHKNPKNVWVDVIKKKKHDLFCPYEPLIPLRKILSAFGQVSHSHLLLWLTLSTFSKPMPNNNLQLSSFSLKWTHQLIAIAEFIRKSVLCILP